jgi:TonB family protein
MKKLLLSILLLAQLGQYAPADVRGQSAPAPAGATQPATPPAGQSAALEEASSLSIKVVQLYQAGKFDEALPLAERALKLREEAVGREHHIVADALKNLGAVYIGKGKADRARQLYTRALSIYEKNPAANNTKIFQLLDALGLFERFAFNNFSAAVTHYERSLALRESSLGAEHEGVLRTLYDLAELYELLGHNDKAIAAHRRVIASREKRAAAHPHDLILALNRFACVIERLGMKAETAEVKRRAEQLTAAEEEKREQAERAQIAGGRAIQGGVINGKALSKPQPVYPELAKERRISGTVTVFVMVDETGRVTEAHPCGHPLLSEAAIRAAYRVRFSSTLLSGQPVKVRGSITYNFVLR